MSVPSVAVAALVAVVVGLLGYGVASGISNENSRDDAIERVTKECGGFANVFDVQDQNRLVYACQDGKLRSVGY